MFIFRNIGKPLKLAKFFLYRKSIIEHVYKKCVKRKIVSKNVQKFSTRVYTVNFLNESFSLNFGQKWLVVSGFKRNFNCLVVTFDSW
jgi:hypothetical protein